MTPSEIKAIIESTGLTQEQFAQLVGVTLTTINNWVNGRTKPVGLSIRRLREIAEQKGNEK